MEVDCLLTSAQSRREDLHKENKESLLLQGLF